jgi:hypothetical protein
MKFIPLLLIFSISVFISSCYYDNEEELYQFSGNCDTTQIAFSTRILPILNQNCNGCHSGASPSAGINLTTHADVLVYVQNGSLIGSIDHLQGFSPMPKSSPKIPECQILSIKKWIAAGSPNN